MRATPFYFVKRIVRSKARSAVAGLELAAILLCALNILQTIDGDQAT
ncbi:MAG: hypothetical protein QG632_345 [Candidatus Dependentiae bacterium]|nr:hypothetical protein [Candidatus Dependentiae bacterium]